MVIEIGDFHFVLRSKNKMKRQREHKITKSDLVRTAVWHKADVLYFSKSEMPSSSVNVWFEPSEGSKGLHLAVGGPIEWSDDLEESKFTSQEMTPLVLFKVFTNEDSSERPDAILRKKPGTHYYQLYYE